MAWANLREELEEEFSALIHDDRAVLAALQSRVGDGGDARVLSLRAPRCASYVKKGRKTGRAPHKPREPADKHAYNVSDRGREARRRYARTEKGKASEARSRAKYRGSEKDRAARRLQKQRWRARKKEQQNADPR